MKNKIIKNSILGSILVAGMIGSFAAIGSINKNEEIAPIVNKTTKEADDTITIWSPWTAGGSQDQPLQDIVNYWNNNLSSEKGFKVEVKTIDGSYSGLTSSIATDIKAGEDGRNDLPNIYIGYSGITSQLIENGEKYQGENIALDFSDESVVGKDNAIDADETFQDGTLISSDWIASADDGSLYGLPMAMSSEVNAIDVPVLIWMLQQFESNGGTVSMEGEISNGILAKKGAGEVDSFDKAVISDEDKATIEIQWKNNHKDVTGQTINITDSTFESAKALKDLGDQLFQVVESTYGDVSLDDTHGFLALDAIANEFYVWGQEITQGLKNPNDGMISINDDDEVQYNLILNDKDGNPSKGQNAAKEIYNYFISGFESGSLWMDTTSYRYASDQFANHNLAMSIGSSAGAKYYVQSEAALPNEDDIYYTQAPGLFEEDSGNKPVRMKQGPIFGGVKKADSKENEQTAEFMKWFVSTNKYTVGDVDMTPGDYLATESGYIVGTKQVLSDGSQFSELMKANDFSLEGQRIAYENFTDKNVELEQEPYGLSTDAFRTEIQTQLKDSAVKITNGETPKTADEFIIDLHDIAAREGWTKDGQIWSDTNGMAWWVILLIILAIVSVIGIIGLLVYLFVFKKKTL